MGFLGAGSACVPGTACGEHGVLGGGGGTLSCR